MSNKDKEQLLEIAKRLEDLFEGAPIDFLGTGSDSRWADKQENEWTSDWQQTIRDLKEIVQPTEVYMVLGGDWLHLHINGERAISVHMVNSQYGNLVKCSMNDVAKLLMGDRPFVYKQPKPKKDGTYE